MALISDILLIAGALGAAFYCIVLSRKLSKLGNLEGGMGRAISALSTQVTDLTRTIDKANAAAKMSSTSLEDVTRRAEDVAKRSEEMTRLSEEVTKRAEATSRMLELQMASMHDLPALQPKPENAATPVKVAVKDDIGDEDVDDEIFVAPVRKKSKLPSFRRNGAMRAAVGGAE